MVGFRDLSESLETSICSSTCSFFSGKSSLLSSDSSMGHAHKRDGLICGLMQSSSIPACTRNLPGEHGLAVIVTLTCSPWGGVQGHRPWQQQCTVSWTLPALYLGPARNSHLNSQARMLALLRFLIKKLASGASLSSADFPFDYSRVLLFPALCLQINSTTLSHPPCLSIL